MNSNKIGAKLKALRGSKTQKEVANHCKISVSSLAMYETGKRIPRDEIKVRLAKYFSIGIADLFFEEKGRK